MMYAAMRYVARPVLEDAKLDIRPLVEEWTRADVEERIVADGLVPSEGWVEWQPFRDVHQTKAPGWRGWLLRRREVVVIEGEMCRYACEVQDA